MQTLFIQTGSPWENGYNDSFNGQLRNEFLNGELCYTLHEAVVFAEQWRLLVQYDHTPQRSWWPTPGPGGD